MMGAEIAVIATVLCVSSGKPQKMTVKGMQQNLASQPGTYIALRRLWNNGDRVEVKLPFSLRTEGFRDNPKHDTNPIK